MADAAAKAKGHTRKQNPFVVCRAVGCMAWAFVKAGLAQIGTVKTVPVWHFPPGWTWSNGLGGLCPLHSRSARGASPTQNDAPACPNCGDLMQQTGKCHTCPNCGHNDGCG